LISGLLSSKDFPVGQTVHTVGLSYSMYDVASYWEGSMQQVAILDAAGANTAVSPKFATEVLRVPPPQATAAKVVSDMLTHEIVLMSSNVILYVLGRMQLTDQRAIPQIVSQLKDIRQRYTDRAAAEVIVVHNLMHATTFDDLMEQMQEDMEFFPDKADEEDPNRGFRYWRSNGRVVTHLAFARMDAQGRSFNIPGRKDDYNHVILDYIRSRCTAVAAGIGGMAENRRFNLLDHVARIVEDRASSFLETEERLTLQLCRVAQGGAVGGEGAVGGVNAPEEEAFHNAPPPAEGVEPKITDRLFALDAPVRRELERRRAAERQFETSKTPAGTGRPEPTLVLRAEGGLRELQFRSMNATDDILPASQ
jgi:hypothetical protein